MAISAFAGMTRDRGAERSVGVGVGVGASAGVVEKPIFLKR